MANQMIALQARGPQLPNLGAAAAQYGNMMANMAVMKEKQAGIQRANAFRQLVSDPGFDPANPEHIKVAASLNPEGAEQIARSYDARRKSQQDYTMVEVKRLRDIGAAVGDEAGYQDWLARVEKVSPGDAAAFRQFSPNFDPAKMSRIIMEADQFINKTIATPSASVQFAPGGEAFGVTVGGLGTPRAEEVIVGSRGGQPAASAPPAAPSAPPVTAAPQAPSAFDRAFGEGIPAGEEAINAAAQAIANNAGINDPALKNLTPKEFDEANLRAGKLMLAKPIAAEVGPAGIAPLTVENAPQIIQTAIQNGFMDQSHVEQLRQMVGPENAPAVDTWLRQNGVQVSSAGMPGMRTAVYRPQQADFGAPVADDGMPFGGPRAPMMQQISNEVGTQFRGRDPMQSPMPGSAIVPIPRISKAAGAEEEGKKTAAYKAELTQSLPKAKGALKLATSQLDRDIADIDYVLRNPYREMVIGQVEGAFPSATSIVNIFRKDGQEAQNVQDRLDKINASSVVKHLQQMREASPQGSSLFGQVTEYEDRLVAALAGLKQTQDEKTFDKALREYRNVLVEMRQNLPEVFNDTYKSVGGKAAIGAPAPAPRKTPTRSDIEYLRRNRKNPYVVIGFRQTFGTAAFNQAMGSD